MSKKITEMFAIVMEDENGVEGIIGENMLGQWFPFIGTDTKNMSRMLTTADAISLRLERPYKILKFRLAETITNVPTQFIRTDGFGTG